MWHCSSILALWHCGVKALRAALSLWHCHMAASSIAAASYSTIRARKLKHFLPSFLPLRLNHFYKELINEVLSSLIHKASRIDTKYWYSVVISHSAPIKTLRHGGIATLPQPALRLSTIQCFGIATKWHPGLLLCCCKITLSLAVVP